MFRTAETAQFPPPRFTALRWIPGDYSRTAIARADQELRDPAHLASRLVLVDGCLFRCLGIALPPHSPPFGDGETMVLQLEPPE